MSIEKSQAILKCFIDLKSSVLFTLGSENETMFCDTYLKFSVWFTLILGDPGADSGGKGKTKRAGKNGAKITFLRAIFFHPLSLSLAPTICPWVSEDGLR